MSEPHLGCPMLKVLELNTHGLLAAAADLLSGSLDADSLIGSFPAKENGLLTRVMDGVFQKDGCEVYEHRAENSNEWHDISTETDEKWEKSLTVKQSNPK